jgi:hypothetical protein
MSALRIKFDASATDVRTDASTLRITLADGREVAAPLEWFPRLRDATPEQPGHWCFTGQGQGVHWSELDEDILVASLLRLT